MNSRFRRLLKRKKFLSTCCRAGCYINW